MVKRIYKVKQEKPIPTVVPRIIRYDSLKKIEPLTPAQEETFVEYNKGKNLFLHGFPGTGKTMVALYLAFKEVLLGESEYKQVIVVRSTVPTRDQGFLPGDKDDKELIYQLPYMSLVNELFYGKDVFSKLLSQEIYKFISTSYIRGITLRNSIVIVDETENLNFGELDSIIGRIGENCKIIFCGDKAQSDLIKSDERNGISKFVQIIDKMTEFSHIEFMKEDIVRSSLVKNYIIKKHELGYNN